MDATLLQACCQEAPKVLPSSQIAEDVVAMSACLSLIQGPYQADQDIPVAAKIWHPAQGWLAEARNTSRVAHDATAHAEINAIRQACLAVGNYRLPDCTLYVTLEPCIMCFSAMMEARISRIVFAASDRKLGVLSKQAYQLQHAQGNHHFTWTGGVCAYEASQALDAFFSTIRR